ncbi:hypothetical protein ACIOUE_00855 [Streptomyces xanthochromogenes]|uniref:hypothetical protein n=1 Tax=Streptomyces xanthochromogenes TaxID=67384 RepID=UPI003824091B
MNDLGIPEFLIDYLAQRDADRQSAAAAAFEVLTDRERRLVHDAAVMGYVQGMRHPQRERIPKDSRIVARVVQECLAFPDLYPAITGYVPEPLRAQCGLSEDEHDADDCEIQADTSEGGDHA